MKMIKNIFTAGATLSTCCTHCGNSNVIVNFKIATEQNFKTGLDALYTANTGLDALYNLTTFKAKPAMLLFFPNLRPDSVNILCGWEFGDMTRASPK